MKKTRHLLGEEGARDPFHYREPTARLHCVHEGGTAVPVRATPVHDSAPRHRSTTTTAAAVDRAWVRVTCTRLARTATSARLAGPIRRSCGGPPPGRTTSTSLQPPPLPHPVPTALKNASFAANRTASDGAGSACPRQYSSSAAVNSRSRPRPPQRARKLRSRPISTRSIPTPTIIPEYTRCRCGWRRRPFRAPPLACPIQSAGTGTSVAAFRNPFRSHSDPGSCAPADGFTFARLGVEPLL